MANFKELPSEQLCNQCDLSSFTFKDTSELEPLNGIIGQERAVKAMEFGLKISISGYNLYMSGQTGTGKTSYAKSYIEKLAKKRKIPDDRYMLDICVC